MMKSPASQNTAIWTQSGHEAVHSILREPNVPSSPLNAAPHNTP